MGNCKNCIHSVFDETWGEYRCKKFESTILILLEEWECREYKRDPDKEKE